MIIMMIVVADGMPLIAIGWIYSYLKIYIYRGRSLHMHVYIQRG